MVSIDKDPADILALLDGEGTSARRPAYGESTADVLARRAPLYVAVSDFAFPIRKGDADWAALGDEFARLARRLVGELPPPPPRPHTFFLSLTQPRLDELIPLLPALSVGVDALELRADLLADASADGIHVALATLRRASALPLIFTLRGANEGGRFAGSDGEYAALTVAAARAAVEFVDVEVSRGGGALAPILNCAAVSGGVTGVIGSRHDFARTPGAEGIDLDAMLRACALDGKAVRRCCSCCALARVARCAVCACCQIRSTARLSDSSMGACMRGPPPPVCPRCSPLSALVHGSRGHTPGAPPPLPLSLCPALMLTLPPRRALAPSPLPCPASRRCSAAHAQSIAKLVLKGESAADSLQMRALADRALPELRKARADVGVIAICVGEDGARHDAMLR